jgi:hypothetical protein
MEYLAGSCTIGESGNRNRGSRPSIDERLADLTLRLTGCVPYAVNGFLASVLCVPNCIVYRAFYLVSLAFRFKFLAANGVPNDFLGLAGDVISCTFHVFLVHVPPSTLVRCLLASKRLGKSLRGPLALRPKGLKLLKIPFQGRLRAVGEVRPHPQKQKL